VSSSSQPFGVDLPIGPPQPILGLAHLRSRQDRSHLDRAYDEGYRVMDTAPIYGLGASEQCLGRWMQLRRNRHEIVIITKGGHPRLWRPGRHRITVECIAKDLAASLRRLRTDYVDVYLLHRDAPECDLPALLHYLQEQKLRGAIRSIGVSNWRHDRVEQANDIARRLGVTEFSASSPQLSLLSWSRPPWAGCVSISGDQGSAARSWYQTAQLPVLAWSPFGGGLKHSPGAGWTATGKYYSHQANIERLTGAALIARQRGISVPQVLVAYLASLSCMVYPICASRNVEHLRANRVAMEVKLSREEIHMLEGEPHDR
jgi:1-deoxyxylulose-5-phosphate synthase